MLGIEVDELFGCDPDSGCTTASVLAALDAYHARGVRHVFPIHLFDNAFGGAALYNDFFDPGNYLAVGSFFSERDCGAEGYAYQLGGPTADLIASLLGVPPRPTLCGPTPSKISLKNPKSGVRGQSTVARPANAIKPT